MPRTVAADAATAVDTLRYFLSLVSTSVFTLDLTVCTRPVPAGAQHRFLFTFIRRLVHNDELVFLPVVGFGFFGAVQWLFEAQGCVPAAAGLGGRVGLAVRSEGALGATYDTFVKARGHPQAAGLWVLDVVFIHRGGGLLEASVGPWGSDDGGGEASVGHDDGGLVVRQVGASILGERGSCLDLVADFQLPIGHMQVIIHVIRARGVDPPENTGDITFALQEVG